MFSFKRRVGNIAEQRAKEYLEQQGYACIEQNYLAKIGEIDIIMRDDTTLVFVEVRYKQNPFTVSPLASITKSKQNKLMRTAQLYLQQHRQYAHMLYRFDVVGVSGSLKYPSIEHIENAIIS